MAGTSGTKEIATRYPVTKGRIAKTTKQTGTKMNLTAKRGSFVSRKRKVGLT